MKPIKIKIFIFLALAALFLSNAFSMQGVEDIDKKVKEDKETLLHIAVRNNDIKKVKTILKKGANINARDATGKTPLHIAAENYYTKIVDLLIKKGADVLAKDNNGMGMIHILVMSPFITLHLDNPKINLNKKQHELLTEELVKRKNLLKHILRQDYAEKLINIRINSPHGNGDTLLHIAAMYGDSRQLQTLLENKLVKKMLINEKTNRGHTPLHIAANIQYESKEKTKLLLTAGADKDLKNDLHKKDYTPLHYATSTGKIETAQLLIEAGADITKKTTFGNNFLHLAIKLDQLDFLKFFINSKEINLGKVLGQKNGNNNTPLTMFVKKVLETKITNQNLKIIETLLTKNPIIELTNKNGFLFRILVDKLVGGKSKNRILRFETVKKLIEEFDHHHGPLTVNKLIEFAYHNEKNEFIKNLIKKLINSGKSFDGKTKLDLNKKDYDGYSPLQKAIIYDIEKITELILSKNVKVDKKNEHKENILHTAVASESLNSLTVILKHKNTKKHIKKMLSEKDISGRTPLIKAAQIGNKKIINILLKASIKITNFNLFFFYGNLLIETYTKLENYYKKNEEYKNNDLAKKSLEIAKKLGHDDVIHVLKNRGVSHETKK